MHSDHAQKHQYILTNKNYKFGNEFYDDGEA